MNNKFRNDLINSNNNFGVLFNKLMEEGEIEEFSSRLWDFILRDRTSIRINGEPLAFKDLFHLNLNEGRCKILVFEFVLLLDKFGVYSEAVECVNEAFSGTAGSSYGGHWYVEVKFSEEIVCIDTSLVIVGSPSSFQKLGHKVVKKYDIDTLFKQNPTLIDYYDEMVINKNNL